jgi:hypothetical protein
MVLMYVWLVLKIRLQTSQVLQCANHVLLELFQQPDKLLVHNKEVDQYLQEVDQQVNQEVVQLNQEVDQYLQAVVLHQQFNQEVDQLNQEVALQ